MEYDNNLIKVTAWILEYPEAANVLFRGGNRLIYNECKDIVNCLIDNSLEFLLPVLIYQFVDDRANLGIIARSISEMVMKEINGTGAKEITMRLLKEFFGMDESSEKND